MTINSVTAALFTWHALKLTWQQHILTTNQILCFPRIERRSHATRQKLFSFHITDEIFGLSAVKTTPSLVFLVQDAWEWNGYFFCTSCRHLKRTSVQKSNKNEIFMARVKNSNCLNFCTQVDPIKTRKAVYFFFLKYVFIFEKNELFAFTLWNRWIGS